MKVGILTKKNPFNLCDSNGKFFKTRDPFPYSHHGFILLEAIICLAILLIILPSAYTFLIQTRKNWQLTQQQEYAILIAKNEILKSEIELNQDIKNVDFTPVYDSRFQINQSIEDRNSDLKKITVEISWNSPQGRKKYEASQLIMPLQKKSMPLNGKEVK